GGRLMALPFAGKHGGYLLQFDYESGKLIEATPIPIRPSQGSTVGVPNTPYAAYFANDRHIVYSAATTAVFDSQTGRELRAYPVGAGSLNFALSPDGKTEAFGSLDGSVSFLDLKTGQVSVGVGAHFGPVNAIGFTP